MRQSRFTEAQIIGMIKEQEAGMPTADVCRKHGLSPSTFYKYKSKYGGMEISDVAKMRVPRRRECQAQAATGRYDSGQRRLEGFAGKELTTSTDRRNTALKAMRDHDISQRRAC